MCVCVCVWNRTLESRERGRQGFKREKDKKQIINIYSYLNSIYTLTHIGVYIYIFMSIYICSSYTDADVCWPVCVCVCVCVCVFARACVAWGRLEVACVCARATGLQKIEIYNIHFADFTRIYIYKYKYKLIHIFIDIYIIYVLLKKNYTYV